MRIATTINWRSWIFGVRWDFRGYGEPGLFWIDIGPIQFLGHLDAFKKVAKK